MSGFITHWLTSRVLNINVVAIMILELIMRLTYFKPQSHTYEQTNSDNTTQLITVETPVTF